MLSWVVQNSHCFALFVPAGLQLCCLVEEISWGFSVQSTNATLLRNAQQNLSAALQIMHRMHNVFMRGWSWLTHFYPISWASVHKEEPQWKKNGMEYWGSHETICPAGGSAAWLDSSGSDCLCICLMLKNEASVLEKCVSKGGKMSPAVPKAHRTILVIAGF